MTTGFGVAVLRGAAVLVPALLTAVLWLVTQSVRVRASAVLAALWNIVGLLVVNAIAVRAGWWAFGTDGSMWAGVPADVVVGWALLWGAVPILLMPWVNPLVTALVLVVGDVFAMAALEPLVVLQSRWWWGELSAVTTCLLPGLLLGWATATGRLLRVRAVLQMVLFGAVLLFVLPTIAFFYTGNSWAAVISGVGGPVDLVLIQVAAVLAVTALRAVADFVRSGGTPYPWDPPSRLVTGGPYAYVANPMQLCAVAMLVIAAAVSGRPALLLAAAIGAVFGSGLAGWHESQQLGERFGDGWLAYRRSVRNWWPRLQPYPGRSSARLYVEVTCDPCSAVGAWFARRRHPTLEICAAEDHRESLRRVRYEDDDGLVCSGTRALGAALEHLSLGYAVLGWLIRAPGLAWLVQVLADAVGGGPREIARPDRSG